MLRIWPVCLGMVREVAELAIAIWVHDGDLCKQPQRSRVGVVLNSAEGAAADEALLERFRRITGVLYKVSR